VNRFINKVLEIKNGCATLYEGNIEDYLNKLKDIEDTSRAALKEKVSNGESEADTLVKQRGKAVRQEQAKLRQEKSRKLSPLKKEAEQAEEEIEKLERHKKELEQLMADPQLYQDKDKFAGCSKEYNSLERKLEQLFKRWEEVQAKIETLESEFEDPL
jgi:ATP-binding cassette subfamily F protein 3